MLTRKKGGKRCAPTRNGKKQALDAWNDSADAEDLCLVNDIWWDQANGGTGASYSINGILPVHPAPLVGMQSWYDTVCSITKV